MKKLFFMLLAFPLVFSACGSDDDDNTITLIQREVVLNVQESHWIEATTSEASYLRFSTDNPFVANVTMDGLVYANKAGEAEILIGDGVSTERFRVLVVAKNNICPDPFVIFGASKKDVIAKLGRANEETATSLSYTNFSDNTLGVVYLFGDNNYRLEAASIIMKERITSNIIKAHLDDRYKFVSFEDETVLYINNSSFENSTMAIGLSVNKSTNSYMLIYVPISDRDLARSAKTSKASILKKMHEAIKLAK